VTRKQRVFRLVSLERNVTFLLSFSWKTELRNQAVRSREE
jgi:hypothetical protein